MEVTINTSKRCDLFAFQPVISTALLKNFLRLLLGSFSNKVLWMARQTVIPGPIIADYTHGLFVYNLIVFIVSASISLIVFFIGLVIVYKQPRAIKNIVFRVLLLIQIMNCLRFIFRILITDIHLNNEAGCRIILFLNNSIVLGIVYMCAYIILYLQLTIIHNVSPYKTWPRALLITACVLCSFGPPIAYFIISPERAGMPGFCTIPSIYTARLFHFLTATVVVWVFLAGIVCLISMVVITVHIFRTSRKTRKFISSIEYSYGARANLQQRPTAHLLNRTLRTVVWFPITPIMSTWFNSALIITRYHTQKPLFTLEYINLSLLSLQTIFMAIAFFANPMVIDFLREHKQSWPLTKRKHASGQLSWHSAGLNVSAHGLFSSQSSLEAEASAF